MKAHVVTKIQITAQPSAVFSYLTELRFHPLWNPHLQAELANKTLAAGTEYHTRSLLFGVTMRSKNVVTDFSPNKLLELTNTTGMLEYCIRYRLHAHESGTLLTCSTTVSSHSSAFAFAKPLLKLLAQRELHTDLQLLKTAVEQKLE